MCCQMCLEKTTKTLKSKCYEVIFHRRVCFLAFYQSGQDQEHKRHLLSGCTFVFQCQIVPRLSCCHIPPLAFQPSPWRPSETCTSSYVTRHSVQSNYLVGWCWELSSCNDWHCSWSVGLPCPCGIYVLGQPKSQGENRDLRMFIMFKALKS